MKQSPPRRQHYVPQLLLRQFAGADGRLWAYDTEKRRCFSAQPKDLAVEEYFYGGSVTSGPTQKATYIEKWLAKEIDAPGAAAIELFLKNKKVPIEQAQAFFQFCAAQMLRTPESLKRIEDYSAPIFQETAERMAKFEPQFRKGIISKMKANGESEEDISQLLKILDEGHFTVTPTRDYTLASALRLIDHTAHELSQMQWTFMQVPAGDPDLIIGDHPVSLTDTRPGEPQPLGLRNPSIELAMPLSRQMVAIARRDSPIGYGTLAAGEVDRINERALRNAYRFVFAPFESPELLARAIALKGTGPKMQTIRLQIGQQLIISPELRH